MSTNAVRPSEPAVADLSTIDPVRCPCGWARRVFGDVAGAPASVHRVEIEADARAHYHRDHTEIYYVLECGAGAAVELDGRAVAVRPGTAVLIPPGVRHRAVGRMAILNVVVPPFDPADEWFD
jgi:mannose-6-phosphate isomerase-like protein (cupin superfamily)